MGRRKEIKSKRNWSNICHYSSDTRRVKNLNEIYRYVFYKPVISSQLQNECKAWIYIDISLDDLLYVARADDVKHVMKSIPAGYKLVNRLRCTGIEDKFGNLIFEGDITEVKFTSQHSEIGCVTFDAISGHYSKGYTDIGSYKKQTEIIGDIFTTPELDWRMGEHEREFNIRRINNE